MSMCSNVNVTRGTTKVFSNVEANIVDDAATIWITLGSSGKEVSTPTVGQVYLLQDSGGGGCIDTNGKYLLHDSKQGWKFQNVE